MLNKAVTDLLANWQLTVQLADEADVARWRDIPLGSLPKFGTQIAAARRLTPFDADVGATLDYVDGGRSLVDRGLAGDRSAAAALAGYIDDDRQLALARSLPVSRALRRSGC